MNPLLEDFGLFLQEHSLIEGDGIDFFRDFIPEEPDSLVALTEYAGEELLMVDPTAHRSVQVVTRDKSPNNAREKALRIFEAFRSNQGEDGRVSLTDDRWCQLYLRQSPFKYKMDENNRAYYCFNLGVTTSIE